MFTVFELMETATKDGVILATGSAKEAAMQYAVEKNLAAGTQLFVLVQSPGSSAPGFIVTFKVERGIRVVTDHAL